LYTFFGQPDCHLRRARPEWASNERVGATSPHAAVTSQFANSVPNTQPNLFESLKKPQHATPQAFASSDRTAVEVP
jgi:hypothetical protein